MVFRPATAIKSQVLADFVAEFFPDMLPALQQEIELENARSTLTVPAILEGLE